MSDNITTAMLAPASLRSSGTQVVSEFGNQLVVDSKGYANVPSHLVPTYLAAGWSLTSADVAANES
jgi:hypothetical protein